MGGKRDKAVQSQVHRNKREIKSYIAHSKPWKGKMATGWGCNCCGFSACRMGSGYVALVIRRYRRRNGV